MIAKINIYRCRCTFFESGKRFHKDYLFPRLVDAPSFILSTPLKYVPKVAQRSRARNLY